MNMLYVDVEWKSTFKSLVNLRALILDTYLVQYIFSPITTYNSIVAVGKVGMHQVLLSNTRNMLN